MCVCVRDVLQTRYISIVCNVVTTGLDPGTDLFPEEGDNFLSLSVAVNVVAIVILSRGKCGLSKCITRYLVAMAVADVMVVVFEVILKRINNIYLPINILFITPVCAMIMVLKLAALDCSVWFTVAFTFDRLVAISSPNLRPRYCTTRTASVVIASATALACLRSIPYYFM